MARMAARMALGFNGWLDHYLGRALERSIGADPAERACPASGAAGLVVLCAACLVVSAASGPL